MSGPKESRGLKKLKPWVSALVPLVLFVVAWNTYFRDRVFAWLLPRKSYTKYVFVPRSISRQVEDSRSEGIKNAS